MNAIFFSHALNSKTIQGQTHASDDPGAHERDLPPQNHQSELGPYRVSVLWSDIVSRTITFTNWSRGDGSMTMITLRVIEARP